MLRLYNLIVFHPFEYGSKAGELSLGVSISETGHGVLYGASHVKGGRSERDQVPSFLAEFVPFLFCLLGDAFRILEHLVFYLCHIMTIYWLQPFLCAL